MKLTKAQIKKIIKEGLTRTYEVKREHIDEEKRTIEIAFSSEIPYLRWYGYEILDHSKGSVRMERLVNKAAFLQMHNHNKQIGVVETATVDPDKRGRALVRFGKGPLATEEFNDFLDGIKSKISVGYEVHSIVLEKEEENVSTYRVTDWEPFELSSVSTAADDSVGLGKSKEDDLENLIDQAKQIATTKTQVKAMEETEAEKTARLLQEKEAKKAQQIEIDNTREQVLKAERERTLGIKLIGKVHNLEDLAEKAVESGQSIKDFQHAALLELAAKSRTVDTPDIGLNKGEIKQFSLMKVARALVNDDWKDAGFERECSNAIALKKGVDARGCYIPFEVQKRAFGRDMTAGGAGTGAELVGTDHLAGSFIDLLYNAMKVKQLGATILGGLVGNVAIPKLLTGAPITWVAESGTPTERTPTTGSVTLTPHTASTHVDLSRLLLKQGSPDVETMISRDMAIQIALGVDLAALHGTGSSNQPTGIAATSGIGSVAGGTDGLAPAWSHIVDLETEVSVDNADIGSLAYLSNAKVRGKLKQVEKASDTAQFVWDKDGLNGYRTEVSNQVASNLVKGSSGAVCSAIFFGNWRDLIIGEWGTLDLIRDPYALSTAGGLRLVALMEVDIAVRHAESFAAMLDALTT